MSRMWPATRAGPGQDIRGPMPKGTSKRPMQQRARETRASVLLAAAHVFDAYGYAGASNDQIAQEGGLTKGALYFPFEPKADLALSVIDAGREIWLQLQADIEARGLPPLERIGTLLTQVAA